MDRIRWAMFNLWDNVFSWGSAVKYFSTFVVKTSYVFIRLIHQSSFLRLFVPMFTKLNMNNNKGKIRLVINRSLNCQKIPIFMQNSFSKRILDSTSWQTEELYTWNLSKSRLQRSWGSELLLDFLIRLSIGLNWCKCWFLDSVLKRFKDLSNTNGNTVPMVPRNPPTCTSNKELWKDLSNIFWC